MKGKLNRSKKNYLISAAVKTATKILYLLIVSGVNADQTIYTNCKVKIKYRLTKTKVLSIYKYVRK